MQRHRQQFLGEEMYAATKRHLNSVVRISDENLAVANVGSRSYLVQCEMIYLENLWLWTLEYTAGCGLPELSRVIGGVVTAFEEWNSAYQLYLQGLTEKYVVSDTYGYVAAPDFGVLGDYQDTIQLLSICILLRRRDYIARIITVLRSHRGRDKLYEELISPYAVDEYYVDTCGIAKPYSLLADAFDETHDKEVLRHVKNYLRAWYPAMSKHPRWYNGHLKLAPGGWANYYGYWAFEAGATVYLLDVNDKEIDSIVYPRDLVEYAMGSRSREEAENARANVFLGCVGGGSLCPRVGYWESPAKAGIRRWFEAGDVMPIFEGTGSEATAWNWSISQEPLA